MADEQAPDAPSRDVAGLQATADQVSGSADALTEQLSKLRAELRGATEKATTDIAAAKAKASADVREERSDRRRAMWRFVLVIAVDVALSLVSLVLYLDQRATDAQLHRTQHNVLCPLYALFIQAVDTAPAGESAQQRASRLAAQQPIRMGYATLKCTPALPPG